MKRVFIALLFIALLVGGGFAYQSVNLGAATSGSQAAPRPPRPVVPVVATAVVRKPSPVRIETIGTVQPLATVAVKSRVDGLIAKVHFTEGQDVKAGDVLFTLDSRAVEAQIRQAEAQLARDRAQLTNAKREVDRQGELVAKNFASGQKYDEVRTNSAMIEATLRADEAAIENLRVQLSYHTITSPIDGRTGAVALKIGSNLKANDTGIIVTINQIRPIYVSFSVPQRDLAEVRDAMRQSGRLETEVQPIGEEPVTERGILSFIDNQIDAATGTITLKSTFPNEKDRLWPGQFVNIALTLRTEPDALVIPAPAVQVGQSGSYVYVIKADMTVETRDVKVTRTSANESVIASGLQEGEQVVVDGQLRLTKGSKVEAAPYQPQRGKGATS